MRTSRRVAVFLFLLACASASWAIDEGQSPPRYKLLVLGPNQTWDIIPLTNDSGNIKGIQCVFANTNGSVGFNFYVDGGGAQPIFFDPSHYPVDSRGYSYTGWVLYNIRFNSSIRIEMIRGLSSTGD